MIIPDRDETMSSMSIGFPGDKANSPTGFGCYPEIPFLKVEKKDVPQGSWVMKCLMSQGEQLLMD